MRQSWSSLTAQPETRLSHHGVHALDENNIRNHISKTGSSFTRHASLTNRSMACKSFTEPEFAATQYKTGPSFVRCTHLGEQVHGVAGVQVTPWRSTSPRRYGLYNATYPRPRGTASFVLSDRRILGV